MITWADEPRSAATKRHMVCGCVMDADHVDGCVLGEAESVAIAAIAAAEEDAGGPLLVALVALANEGLLRPLGHGSADFASALHGVLDALYEQGLISRTSSVEGG